MLEGVVIRNNTDLTVETETIRVVSLSTTEITEMTRFKNRSAGSGYLK